MGEAALMIGGFDKPEVTPLSSAVLYPESCSVPSLEAGLAGQVTFVIQDSTPTVATCGGDLGGGKYTKDCVVLQGGVWVRGVLEDLPDIRDRSASVRIEDGVYILGGRKTQDTSIFLRANSRSWETGPTLPPSPAGYGDSDIWSDSACAAQITAHSFLIQHRSNVFEFDANANGPTNHGGWAPPERWPQLWRTTDTAAGCGVVNDLFVVATDVGTEIINLSTRTLSQGGQLAKNRRFFKLLSINGQLFALGGWYWTLDLGHHFLSDVDEFMEETGTWTSAPALPGNRGDGGGVAVDVSLVCG